MPLRRLFLDSRFRTSGTDSDFILGLSEDITLQLGARCYIASISLSNVFYSVEEIVNDQLYVAMRHNGSTGGHKFKLSPGNYGGEQFVQEIQTKLRTIDVNCQVSYIKNQGRAQIAMSRPCN